MIGHPIVKRVIEGNFVVFSNLIQQKTMNESDKKSAPRGASIVRNTIEVLCKRRNVCIMNNERLPAELLSLTRA